MTIKKNISKLVTALSGAGATRIVLIGGAVIDTLQNREVKDWDIEVFGLSMADIQRTLTINGFSSDMVGAAFGVIKTKADGIDIDLSVPRKENKVGNKHTDFEVSFDPFMTPTEAGKRRDLTINAMSRDIVTGELIDPFNGLADLEAGILRATDPVTFVEDPLRVLRIMQLLPRKGKNVDPNTIELCRSIKDTFTHLPKERVFEEFVKLLLKAKKPSMGLQFLRDCGWIEHFPALNDLIGCEQNPEWHPEGDVWNHTLMVVDNAAALRHNISEELRLAFMFGALLHDVGKPSTTDEQLRSPGHDEAGVEIAKNFLMQMTNSTHLLNVVPDLVKFHMRPGQLTNANAKDSAWKRLHIKCRLDVLGWLSKADSAGRTGRSITDNHPPSEKCFKFFNEFPTEIEPLVMGRDLLEMGMKPGPKFGKILKVAFEMQLDGATKDEILKSIK